MRLLNRICLRFRRRGRFLIPLCRFLLPFSVFVLFAWGGYRLRTAGDGSSVVVDPNKIVNFDERRHHQRQISVFLDSKIGEQTLGNHMFAYAALYGISKRNRMIPVVSALNPVAKEFALTVNQVPSDRPGRQFAKYKEKSSEVYDRNTEYLNPDINIELTGEFRSWKYFEFFHNEIRQEFTFHEDTSEKSHDFLENYVEFYKEQREHEKEPRLIGVYVQHKGEKLVSSESTKQFVMKAMAAYRKRYHQVLFIVASDDPEWTSEHLEATDVAFTEGSSLVLDLAILGRCNHTIFTTGEVGWWAAWLAGGDVVYHKDAQPVTLLANSYYLPRTWKPM